MQWSNVFGPKQQYVWETTSQDYHSHISRIERTPSVLPDVPNVPHYPNVHKVFKNNYAYGEEEQQPKSKKSSAKKVQLNDQHVEIIESAETDDSREVKEGTVDVEADGFIKKKHRGFELCKWKTFKLH